MPLSNNRALAIGIFRIIAALLIISSVLISGVFQFPSTGQSAYAQTTLLLEQFGTTAADTINGIATDSTGVYLVGYTDGALEGTNAGHSDVFVRKYDTNGNIQWTDQFGTSGSDFAYGAAADSTGVYVAGLTFGSLSGTNAGNSDAFIRKYDTDGNLQWTRQFGTSSGDTLYGIAVDSSSIYVTGATLGALEGTNAGDYDAYLRKYTIDGLSIVWTRQFGTASTDFSYGIAAGSSGVYVSGWTAGNLEGTNAGNYDAFIRMYDTNGNVLWTDQFGGSEADYLYGSMAVDSTSVYAAGFTASSLEGTSAGGSDAYIRKYDTDGAVSWTDQFGTSSDDVADTLAADSTGVYVSGYTFGALSGTNAGAADAFVHRYNANGDIQWTRQFGTTAYDNAFAVAVDSTGVYVTGSTTGALEGTSAGNTDIFLAKFEKNSTPSATAQTVTTDEDTAKAITLSGTDNDANESFTYSIASSPSHGTLSGFNSASGAVTYTPEANYNGADSFTFKVSDGVAESSSATVGITVNAVNDAPVSHAGADKTVNPGSAVTLDGSASSDTEGSTLTYSWMQISGTSVTLSDSTVQKPTFVAPTALSESILQFRLIVNDGQADSSADDVEITVKKSNTLSRDFTSFQEGDAKLGKKIGDFAKGTHALSTDISGALKLAVKNDKVTKVTVDKSSLEGMLTIDDNEFELTGLKVSISIKKSTIELSYSAKIVDPDNSAKTLKSSTVTGKTVFSSDFNLIDDSDADAEDHKNILKATIGKAKFDTKKTSLGSMELG